jgi:hypothetical protein
MRGGGVFLVATMALTLVATFPQSSYAELATADETSRVCQNWLSYNVYHDGTWAEALEPKIAEVQELRDGDRLLAYCYTISPSGSVVVPVLKELPPVKASSQEFDLDVSQTVGMPQLLREVLADRFDRYIKRYGSLEVSQPTEGPVLFGRINRQEWDRYLASAEEFAAQMAEGRSTRGQVGPLLTTAWHQGSPYNDLCPMGDGGQTVTGCVATAMAQLMRYWLWPSAGQDSHSYWWDGDDSCGGSTSGMELSAFFYDLYDWDNMPDSCYGGCTTAEQQALAELSYECGVAVEMDYGHCGSSSLLEDAVYALETYFSYAPGMQTRHRWQHSASSWFNLVVAEINLGRPLLYTIYMHMMVCDGWRDATGQNQYHMNYGWGGSYNGWYTVDQLYCQGAGCDPMEESLLRYIRPYGAANDVCVNAIEIGDGTTYGSTAFTTNDGSASCGYSSTSPDVWYSYTAEATGTLHIDTCGSSYNTVLSIHTGCPGTSANELACNDNDDYCGSGSQQSAISLETTPATTYIIRVSGYNGIAGDFKLNVHGPSDTYPPDPDPMSFVTTPHATSASDVSMTASTASDIDSPPVSYYFEFVDVQIPGGHDSGWQEEDTGYADSGLMTNCLYGYHVRARDSLGNETQPSETYNVATFIETPQSAPIVMTADTTVDLATTETFTNLTWNQSGLYFDCTTPGGDGGINEWIQTTWTMATGLTPDTQYTFRFKARNQDGVETDWSPERTRRTKAAVPSAPVLTNVTCDSVDIAIGADINPEYTTYAIQCTQTDPTDANWEGMYIDAGGNPGVDPVYQTATDWAGTTVLGLAEETTYTFAAHAKNGLGITTDPGPEAFITTPPCSAIECADLPDPAVCMGDVNSDGEVTPTDVGLVKYWYGDTDPANLCYYDINCDGTIDPVDVGLVKYWYGVCDAEDPPPCWAE